MYVSRSCIKGAIMKRDKCHLKQLIFLFILQNLWNKLIQKFKVDIYDAQVRSLWKKLLIDEDGISGTMKILQPSKKDEKYDVILVCVKLSIWNFENVTFCWRKKYAVADFIYLRFIWYENRTFVDFTDFCWVDRVKLN